MADVWLATDLRLERKVALKLLPVALTTDPVRVKRFEQEARAASALNHSNICTIHALEDSGNGQRFIAMEYIEGRTLRNRLAQGRLAQRECLDIAVQIASALTAAHAAGVVHRDVKPDNVMLRPDGVVKVLDFGLAKLAARDSDPAQATQTAVHTDAGMVVGTVLYMSPEQARGLTVDVRTDVWSLGIVLYEMVAGRPPFPGQSTSDIIAAILEHEFEPLARIAPDASNELVRIIGKTLRKDPDQRYQVMKDLLLDLQALRDEVVSTAGAQAGSRPGERTPGRRRAAIAAVSVALLVVIAAAAWSRKAAKPLPPPPGGSSASIHRPLTRLTFDVGLQTDAAFSPDGRSIAYASDRAGNFDIWLQPLDGGEARQITNSPAPDTQPAWSPDGKSIVFRSERDKGGLFLVSAQRGAERQLTSFGVHPVWSPDGSEILFRSGLLESYSGIHAVSPGGGEPPRDLAQGFLREGVWTWIAPHPDGRISVMGVHPKSRFGFYTVSRDGTQVVSSKLATDLPLRWTEQGTRLLRFQWNGKGTALYLEAILNEVQNVWRVRVDPATLEWMAAERLTTGSGPDAAAALSRSGERMAFTVQQRSTRLWMFPLDSAAARITGRGVPLTPEDGRAETSALSADGRFVAFMLRRAGTTRVEMLLTDIDANKTELFAVDAAPGAWSPDGRTLAYALSRPDLPPPGEWALAVREVGGPERIIRRWSTESVVLPSSWTPDGQFILGSYVSPLYTGVAKLALWPVSPSARQTERVLIADSRRMLWQGRVSPNGRWVSFVAQMVDDRSHFEINVAPVGAGASEWVRIAATHPWVDKPRWAPDGRMLYFISNETSSFFNLWGVKFDPDRGTVLGAPFALTKFDSPSLVISPDVSGTEIGISARRALLTMASTRGNIWMLENVER
jgi:Tol biopolymer transport system component